MVQRTMVNNRIERLADRILGQIYCHFQDLNGNLFKDEMLLNESPIDKVCSLALVSRVVLRDGFNFEVWVDSATQIPLLKYQISR